jgi:hypothetical protein
VSTTLQGDDAADLRNGIVVVYDDVLTGLTERLTPDDYDELRDDSRPTRRTSGDGGSGVPTRTSFRPRARRRWRCRRAG